LKTKITILCPEKVKRGGLLYFYSLFPFLRKKYSFVKFEITNSLEYCLTKDPNENLLVVRYISNNHKFDNIDTTEILNKLRDKYKNLSIFDDGARTSIDYPQALPIVDSYLHCQLHSDLNNYKRPIKRGQLYSEFYSQKGVSDNSDYKSKPIDDEQLSKIHLAWNIGAGCYPRKNLLRKAGLLAANYISTKLLPFFYTDPTNSNLPSNEENFDVQARFSIQSVPTIAYQRELVLERVKNDKRVLTGFISPRKFNHEIKNTKIILSPFGWGEVCFRDFEAVLNGALLLKPDMSHIKTWPDIYIPDETYIPFKWNCEDLPNKIDEYLANTDKRRKITKRAFQVYMDELSKLDEKVEEIVKVIVS
jgi:hypothetical protein